MARILHILVAEDDANDRALLNLACRGESIPAELHIVQDGEQAIQYLQGVSQFADREKFPFPDLLLLDLKMPRLGGMDVLQWVRGQASCGALPSVMLSGSGLPKDIQEAYRLGANGYFRKPSSVGALTALLRTLANYWLMNERPYIESFSR
jgi:CheY-like chemotaxis protein